MEVVGLLNPSESFKRHFELVPALFEDLREAAFHIRHQVYCEDLKYEPVRGDRMETDEFDAHSVHCLLREIESGDFVGCVRVVLARPGNPDYPFPFERTCADTLVRSTIDPAKLPRQRMGEISRLAVLKRYRRRKGEEQMPLGVSANDFGTPEQPRFPYIPLALYFSAVALALQHGVEHLFVLTELRLAAHFRKLGARLEQVGGPVQHRGTRIPSALSASSVRNDLKRLVQPLYDVVSEEVDEQTWLRK
jgi:N-acyl amino acid synthase of PEP-CTERM/exosortase system